MTEAGPARDCRWHELTRPSLHLPDTALSVYGVRARRSRPAGPTRTTPGYPGRVGHGRAITALRGSRRRHRHNGPYRAPHAHDNAPHAGAAWSRPLRRRQSVVAPAAPAAASRRGRAARHRHPVSTVTGVRQHVPDGAEDGGRIRRRSPRPGACERAAHGTYAVLRSTTKSSTSIGGLSAGVPSPTQVHGVSPGQGVVGGGEPASAS